MIFELIHDVVVVVLYMIYVYTGCIESYDKIIVHISYIWRIAPSECEIMKSPGPVDLQKFSLLKKEQL